jgi:hypothetical protein
MKPNIHTEPITHDLIDSILSSVCLSLVLALCLGLGSSLLGRCLCFSGSLPIADVSVLHSLPFRRR